MTAPDQTDLVERLRKRCTYGDARLTHPHDLLAEEAADALSAKDAELAKVREEREALETKKISLQDDVIPEILHRAEVAEKEVESLKAALAESDRQAEKLEALLDPHISWDGQPPQAETAAQERVRVLESALDADKLASTVAEIRQGASGTPRCEPPGEYEVSIAREWVVRVLKAIEFRRARTAMEAKTDE